ncbi:hypothetical protein LRAMOSA03293 [Lichtheimia ramosa]|uniref:SAM-dependent MTase RsmB/NOP-type domain-containing protein n=1 Tax=Lichtheimia ramosa TaxID=688394 RepID=A0A077WUV5_9FUNG|nr:hypothetical protein LRAMOSA03293 [Lichtheimia ramosa]
MNFYHHAASILDKLNERKGTIKGLVIGDPKVRDKKKMYALVCETLKYKAILNELIDTTGICQKEKKLLSSRSLTQVLMHDMLFTKRGIPLPISVPHKKAIQGYQTRLKAELAKIKIKRGAKSNSDLINEKAKSAVLIPRYVRVNTHRMTMDEAIEAFKKEGYTFKQDTQPDLASLELKTFCRDEHLDDLLVFAPKTDLHNHPLYDKASCFPAHVCRPPLDAHAIDACAAPGNKTSHLSALMKNTGHIWAFDLDMRRLDLLKRLTSKAGCSNIEPIHGSFLDVDPNDPKFSEVEYFLLDPSCSGSGIVSRLDHLVDDEDQEQAESDERLVKLAEFQVSVIQHAFKFPKAKRVVYSTCSIHPQENEHVVRTILADNPEFELASRDSVLPTWSRRGVPKEFNDSNNNTVLADSVVRSDPYHDLTNGFFVACFVRKAVSDKPVKRKLEEQEHVEPEVEEQKVEQQQQQKQQQQPAAQNASNTNKKKRKNKKRKTAVTA